jgi:hypothetical protein
MSIEPSLRMQAEGIPWQHEIRVALPASYYKTTKAYPVLWLTDGSYYFEPAISTLDSLIYDNLPEMIIIAVGAPPEASLDEYASRRLFDFTPTEGGPEYEGFGSELMRQSEKARDEKAKDSGTPVAKKYGGAPAFLRFLVDSLRPALARRYRMSSDNTLFGDSGGGIFCTYALFARPVAFDKYICGSPALYWANYQLFRMEDQYAGAHKDLQAEVFFGVGEDEIVMDGPGGTFSSTARMAEILNSRRYPSLALRVRVFSGEDHRTVIPLNLSWGLRALWADRTRREEIKRAP